MLTRRAFFGAAAGVPVAAVAGDDRPDHASTREPVTATINTEWVDGAIKAAISQVKAEIPAMMRNVKRLGGPL